jgi:antitoxin FitA
MGRLVQVRDVPENVHRTLKARAAQSGSSLSEYLRAELGKLAALPSPDELRARLRERAPLRQVPDRDRPTAVIRRLRNTDR